MGYVQVIERRGSIEEGVFEEDGFVVVSELTDGLAGVAQPIFKALVRLGRGGEGRRSRGRRLAEELESLLSDLAGWTRRFRGLDGVALGWCCCVRSGVPKMLERAGMLTVPPKNGGGYGYRSQQGPDDTSPTHKELD